MAIKYYLMPNLITPDPNDQSARVVSNRVLDFDTVIVEMLRRGSTITGADIKAVLEIFFDVVIDEIVEGNNVNLPLVNIRPGIVGVFASKTDTFDPSRHVKKANLSAGVKLYQKMTEAHVEKVAQPIIIPALIEFLDIETQTTNGILTPGSIGQLVGEELKFNPENPAEGVFFNASDGTAVKATVMQNRTEGKLVFRIPPLADGGYILEVRKGYGSNVVTVRSGFLTETLTVS